MDRRKFIERAGVVAGSALIGRPLLGNLPLPVCDASAEKPNILFIMTDQQSADAMSCRMGRRYISTPAMDRLASAGVSFTRAYTASPLCVPARASIFTEQYPHVTDIQTNSDLTKSLAGRYPCLGRYFHDGGYDTGYVGKWHFPYPVTENRIHGFQSVGTIKNNGVDNDISPFAREFILRKRQNPFFLVASFVNPHNICEWARGEELKDGAVGGAPQLVDCPPAVENAAPTKDETDIMLLMRRSYQANRLFPVGDFDEKKWREYRWAYFRMIEKVDAHIAAILEALRQSGQADRTLIVLTSDHGDMQGAHGWSQKTVFYDNSSRVPLIIAAPGMDTAIVSNHLVNTGIDLLPTLCDYAGIDAPATLPGIALRPGTVAAGGPDPRTYIVVENKMIQGSPIDGQKPEPGGRMVRSARFMYCAYDTGASRESLIDMERDPGETANLAGRTEYRNELEQHRACLAEWCQANNDRFEIPR